MQHDSNTWTRDRKHSRTADALRLTGQPCGKSGPKRRHPDAAVMTSMLATECAPRPHGRHSCRHRMGSHPTLATRTRPPTGSTGGGGWRRRGKPAASREREGSGRSTEGGAEGAALLSVAISRRRRCSPPPRHLHISALLRTRSRVDLASISRRSRVSHPPPPRRLHLSASSARSLITSP
jgi:hypothetical protein